MPFNISVVIVVILNLLSIFISKPTYAQCTVHASVQHATCSGQTDGAINLQVNGTPPYKFEWSNGANTQNLTNLFAGNYTVKITDAKGQKAQVQAIVIETSPLEVKTEIKHASLARNDGAVKIITQQPEESFTYHWLDLQTNKPIMVTNKHNSSLSGLSVGSYAVSIRHISGCRKVIEFQIYQQ